MNRNTEFKGIIGWMLVFKIKKIYIESDILDLNRSQELKHTLPPPFP